MARAERNTVTNVTPEYYSDFLINFEKHPITNSLARITNEDSVKNSLKNIILTRLGERFYAPFTGSKVASSLFDLNTNASLDVLRNACEEAIKNCEPRVVNYGVNVNFPEDGDGNSVLIEIFFEMVNLPGRQFDFVILKRIR